ncbi:LLM class flavin-dependent oxidoreductase [Aureisphaera galaxeae]|uniref:LLM class flavin-dependent oxidoreductase n=1 Tax=Aureisphaera galaxeae TaxID=1538023 RepID=UPI002350AF2C|nr:LLM class flavin-dependent oxidoreductase [Aureisphaera galaxeae]MDC8004723.1 LLM class flavin-dependent oxidoreductase [Aureisphaera galaxeae]
MKSVKNDKVKVFTTIRRVEDDANYASRLQDMINKNEALKFDGILFFQNNSNDIEPWVLGQEIFGQSLSQSPIIAVNPVYIHPYTVAQKIATLSKFYKRKTYLNFITGTSNSDREAIGDQLSHAERYDRLDEYIEIIYKLLSSKSPVNFQGTYYTINNLKLTSVLDESLFPVGYLAGSSPEAQKIRKKRNLANLRMGKPLAKCTQGMFQSTGMYFGIIARETRLEAISVMKNKFQPEYEEYDELLELSMLNTDAVWKKLLKEETEDDVFRMEPFQHFNADCPYLVGSFEDVATYIGQYIDLGVDSFVIDADLEELDRIAAVFRLFQPAISIVS